MKFSRFVLSTAASAAFTLPILTAAPVLAQTVQPQDTDQTEARWLAAERIQVAPAELIIGLNLTDDEEQVFGTITYLMLDLERGEILYTIASAGQEEFGTFLAVPWDVIEVSDYEFAGWRTTGLRLNASTEELENAIRYDMERILELTSPVVAAEVADQYGAVTEHPVTGETVLLYGQEMVGTVSAPPAMTDAQLHGSMIHTSDDLPLGEIDQIMLHVEEGRASYVLVSVGGYLGGAAGWVPIPPQALEWEPGVGRYRIDMTREELDALPLAGAPQLGAFVRATDLESLYEAYGIEPYWKN